MKKYSFDDMLDIVCSMSDEDIVECYNIYLTLHNLEEDIIHYMEDIELDWWNLSVREIFEKVDMEEFDIDDRFYHYTAFGATSFDDVFADNSPIDDDMSALVSDIIDNPKNYMDCLDIARVYGFEE